MTCDDVTDPDPTLSRLRVSGNIEGPLLTPLVVLNTRKPAKSHTPNIFTHEGHYIKICILNRANIRK